MISSPALNKHTIKVVYSEKSSASPVDVGDFDYHSFIFQSYTPLYYKAHSSYKINLSRLFLYFIKEKQSSHSTPSRIQQI